MAVMSIQFFKDLSLIGYRLRGRRGRAPGLTLVIVRQCLHFVQCKTRSSSSYSRQLTRDSGPPCGHQEKMYGLRDRGIWMRVRVGFVRLNT